MAAEQASQGQVSLRLLALMLPAKLNIYCMICGCGCLTMCERPVPIPLMI
jgi:hypothetical protein